MQGAIEEDERLMAAVSTALQRQPSERQAYLRLACGDDDALFCEAVTMLKEEEKMGSFLLHPMIVLKEFERPFQPGETVLERFEIVREIGEGGMGVVYEAFDRKRGLRIAIKAAKPGFQRLLSPELEGALTVRHPNVCLVNDIYTIDTHPGELDFLTMELLEGETLSAYLNKRGKLPESEALLIARQLCAGLAEAHRKGIIHRDLKSANVILCRPSNGERRAAITDFGLSGTATEGDDFAGTPQYMAPEIWQGEKTSKASDIYALGVILYEMVADPTLQSVGIDEQWVPETRGLSKAWAGTIVSCVAQSPPLRPKDATTVLAGLEKRPSPWRFLAAVPLFAALPFCFSPVRNWAHDRIWPPPNVRLALLPATASDSSLRLTDGVLQDASDRISHLTSGSRLVQVIPPTEARRIHIQTPEQAQQAHATHALETSIRRDGADLIVEGALIDLKTKTHIREFSNRYSLATSGAIPSAIAGTVSAALALRGTRNSEAVSLAASTPYDRGLQEMLQVDPDTRAAIQFFQQAALLDQSSPLPLAALVEAEVKGFSKSKDASFLSKAENDLRAAEKLNPDSLSVHFAAGTLNEATGEYEKARDQYMRASDLEPHSVKALIRVARMYNRLGMPEKAVITYTAAINLDPTFYLPYEHLGGFYMSRGRYSEAAEEYRKVIERSPQAFLAYTNLAVSLLEIGQNPQAEQALSTALKIKETPSGLNNMGDLLASEKRDAEAIPYFERSLLLDPHEYLYILGLGDSYRRLGHSSAANAQYREGMALTLAELGENPRTAMARASLAYFAARLGFKERAKEEIKQALQLSFGDTQVIRFSVLTYEVLGQRNSALAVLKGATPQLLHSLDREPDLADFLNDSRFKEISAVTHKGDSK